MLYRAIEAACAYISSASGPFDFKRTASTAGAQSSLRKAARSLAPNSGLPARGRWGCAPAVIFHARLHRSQRLRVAVDVELALRCRVEHLCATSAAVTLPLPTALSLMAWPMSWLLVGFSEGRSCGRLRWLWLMPVGTKYGHSTLAPIWSVTSDRSW